MKAAIVTGASSGIGLEISKTLIKNHYKVYGFGRDFSNLSLDSGYFSTLPSGCFVRISCDITKTPELCTKIKEIQKYDEIHILVNNAGVGFFGPHEELNPKKIHEMVAVNLEAPMILTQLLLRDIKKHTGYIVNISSITAKKSNTHGCA